MKNITTILLTLLVLAGCNTVNGIGKDFETLGGKVQDASKK
jgi:predicted small secreted protein